MSETTCPACHHPVDPTWTECPNCGQRNPEKYSQAIRCQQCRRQVPGKFHICPYCGADVQPKTGSYLQYGLVLLLLAALLFGLIEAFTSVPAGAQKVALLVSSPTPTSTYTPTATHTPTPTSTHTPTPTDTPTPTSTHTPTPTNTPTITPTPTETPEEYVPPTWTPTPTGTPTATHTPTPRFQPPVLLGPKDGKIFGRDEELILRWESVGTLAEDEWYAVRMTWQENGRQGYGGTNVKETYWLVPSEQYWGKADEFTGREYQWFVFIEKIAVNKSGQQVSNAVSDVSETLSFLWQ